MFLNNATTFIHELLSFVTSKSRNYIKVAVGHHDVRAQMMELIGDKY